MRHGGKGLMPCRVGASRRSRAETSAAGSRPGSDSSLAVTGAGGSLLTIGALTPILAWASFACTSRVQPPAASLRQVRRWPRQRPRIRASGTPQGGLSQRFAAPGGGGCRGRSPLLPLHSRSTLAAAGGCAGVSVLYESFFIRPHRRAPWGRRESGLWWRVRWRAVPRPASAGPLRPRRGGW